VPMPIIVRTRKYDEQFYGEITAEDGRPKTAAEAVAELFDF
jgi:hypothetical protein